MPLDQATRRALEIGAFHFTHLRPDPEHPVARSAHAASVEIIASAAARAESGEADLGNRKLSQAPNVTAQMIAAAARKAECH